MKNLIYRWLKKADIKMNRILLPKLLIDKYGSEFYIEWYDDDTILLVPVNKD